MKTKKAKIVSILNPQLSIKSTKSAYQIADEIDALYATQSNEPEGGARKFVESCDNLTEYVAGKKIAERFKKYTVPVIEYNELRERADLWDKSTPKPTELPSEGEIRSWINLQRSYNDQLTRVNIDHLVDLINDCITELINKD